MVKQRSNVASLLNSSGATQTANSQIEQLLSEIEQLKADNRDKRELEQQIEVLREQLKLEGESLVSIDSIVPNPNQPRKTFAEADIRNLAQSLERNGQLEPIILIRLEDGRNMIFDGERRWRAAPLISLGELKSVFIPALETKELHRKALITTLCRQDLNALDRTEAVLHEIEIETGISPTESANLVKSCIYRLDRRKLTKKLTENLGQSEYDFTGLDLSDIEVSIIKVILDLTLNPSSFVAQDLKALAFPDDIKSAIRERGLQIKHSLALSRLSTRKLKVTEVVAKRTRKKAITHVLDNNLSAEDTTAYVNSLLLQQGDSSQDTINPKQKAILSWARKIINTLNRSDLPVETLSVLEEEMRLILEKIQQKKSDLS